MSKNMLVGIWFITHTHNGDREYQGQILDALENGFYLVQLYSWMTGDASILKIFSMHKLGSASLFKNSDDFINYLGALD